MRSAKAVKITDASLIKKLGLLCGFVSVALLIRTLVSPPDVIVGRTADNLKAFLCKTDWWDHTFTSRKWKSLKIESISMLFSPTLSRFSWSLVSCLGCSPMHCCTESSLGIQRKPFYIDGNLQRVSSYLLSQCFNVSLYLLLYTFCLSFWRKFFTVLLTGCTSEIHENYNHYVGFKSVVDWAYEKIRRTPENALCMIHFHDYVAS